MRIGIVLHPYGEGKPAGLGRAIYEITRSLIERDRDNRYVVYLRKKPKMLPVFSGSNWEIKILGNRFLWLDFGLWGEKLDVCIFNTPVMPLFVKPKKSIVITYDYAYHYFEHPFWLEQYHKFSLRRADRIVAISEYTKQETIKLFDIREEKVNVVYLGFKNFCEGAPTAKPVLGGKKFFLFVGVIKERKNPLGIVKAFYLLKEKTHCEHVLALLGWGKGPYWEEIKIYIKEHSLETSVIIDEETRDDGLLPYYQQAEALLYPSFIEGFGFPVLEAFSCGLPVITSTTSSLPEVGGDAALLVNPHKTEEIAAAMERILTEKGLRDSLIKKGYEQMKKFSWENTARGYIDIIDSM